jgi:DNA-binding Lrp family transcriptional regulator
MTAQERHKLVRRPRFRRAPAPPAFRLTEGDIDIVRAIARHRFLRSTQIAALVGRSLDRTNDRLLRLFHAGYVDRPRAQLDYYPTSGSEPMVYALADCGARLLADRHGVGWNRKNHEAGRPFLEHQLEVAEFYVALEEAARHRTDVRLLHANELIAAFPEETRSMRNPLAQRAAVPHAGDVIEIGIMPDLIFGLGFPDGSRRCFMVEIDRGTMPITRSDVRQSSFERKMRAYLHAYAAKLHERQFGWKAFRVLTVVRDATRARSILATLRQMMVPDAPGPVLFLFAVRDELRVSNPLSYRWYDGIGRQLQII